MRLSPQQVNTLLTSLGVKGTGSRFQRKVAERVGSPLLSDPKGEKSLGMVRDVDNFLRKSAIKNPVLTGLAAGGTGAFLLGQGSGLVGAGLDTFDWRGKFDKQLTFEKGLSGIERAERMRAERTMMDMRRNTAVIMQEFPHLAAQLTAGRRLPRGAVVLGGIPRTDLLEEVAMQMSTGDIAQHAARGMGRQIGGMMGPEDLFLGGR
jgi:hypothetical protein